MSMMRRWIPGLLVLPALWLLHGDALAQCANSGAQSLNIQPGARAEGMGRTFTAIADDAYAPWWNPGGLGFLPGRSAALMHTQLVPDLADDVYFEYASYAQHVSGWGGVALTLTYLNYGESIHTEAGSSEEISRFRSFEVAPSLAIGTAITRDLGVGINLKFAYVDLSPALSGQPEGKGSTFAVDLGALYKMKGVPVNLAAVIQNLGPNIALVDENQSDPLSRGLRLAAAAQILDKPQHSVIAAFDTYKCLLGHGDSDTTIAQNWFEENEVLLHVGGEYTYNNLLAGRVGYIFDDVGEIKDLTYGVGLTIKRISFDFASIPQNEELERVKKFSLSVQF